MPESLPESPASAAVRKLRTPPHSTEAEQAVLGGLLVAEDALQAWDEISELREENFYHQEHRNIFKAFSELADEQRPFDVVTVVERLKRNKQLDAIGGMDYLVTLNDNIPTAVNISSYAEIVREYSLQRRLIGAAREVSESCYKNPEGYSSQQLLTEAERTILRVGDERQGAGGPEAAKEVLDRTLAHIEHMHKQGGKFIGLETGFEELDRRTAGLQSADLVILAARPSVGKTALAMNIAQYATLNQKQPVIFFSMEMSSDSLMQRMLSAQSLIPHRQLRNGRLQEEDFDRLNRSVQDLRDIRLFIDPGSELSPAQLRSRVRRLARTQGQPALIVVDYLQLMHGAERRPENRNQEVAGITRSLKAMAKEFNCPLLVLSQLSRSPEQRTGVNKRPSLSDLRDSGAIEQDADLVLFLHSKEGSQQAAMEDDGEHGEDVREVELIIGKQRNGPIGSFNLLFQSRFICFQEIKREYEDMPGSSPF